MGITSAQAVGQDTQATSAKSKYQLNVLGNMSSEMTSRKYAMWNDTIGVSV